MASRLLLNVLLVATCLSAAFAQDYAQAALKAHNNYRSKHQQTGPMKLDKNLSAKAQTCAQKNADRGDIAHDCEAAKGYGENLAWNMASTPVKAAEDAVKVWYDEKKDYDYDKPGFDGSTGHFTQVVWKKSTTLGCGVAKNGNRQFISCLYSPPGNYEGQFKENVLREKK